VVGDTIYDVVSAGKLGLPCICLLSGGIEYRLLVAAGVARVNEGSADLLAHLDRVLNWSNLANLAAQPL
jgi:phosphoglycolate phosphatase-like HAD superfamily hydrolase